MARLHNAGLVAALTLSAPAFAQGSGSKASLSLLFLDDPIPICLSAGTDLFAEQETNELTPASTLETATTSRIWAISFDQSVIEVEVGEDFFFTHAGSARQGSCEDSLDQ